MHTITDVRGTGVLGTGGEEKGQSKRDFWPTMAGREVPGEGVDSTLVHLRYHKIGHARKNERHADLLAEAGVWMCVHARCSGRGW